MTGQDEFEEFKRIVADVQRTMSEAAIEDARLKLVNEKAKHQVAILLGAMNSSESGAKEKIANIALRLVKDQTKTARTVSSLFEALIERYDREIEDAGIL